MYTQISIENTTSQANKYEDLLHCAFIRIQRSENFNFNKTRVCTQIDILKNRPKYALYTCIFKGSIVIV